MRENSVYENPFTDLGAISFAQLMTGNIGLQTLKWVYVVSHKKYENQTEFSFFWGIGGITDAIVPAFKEFILTSKIISFEFV